MTFKSNYKGRMKILVGITVLCNYFHLTRNRFSSLSQRWICWHVCGKEFLCQLFIITANCKTKLLNFFVLSFKVAFVVWFGESQLHITRIGDGTCVKRVTCSKWGNPYFCRTANDSDLATYCLAFRGRVLMFQGHSNYTMTDCQFLSKFNQIFNCRNFTLLIKMFLDLQMS